MCVTEFNNLLSEFPNNQKYIKPVVLPDNMSLYDVFSNFDPTITHLEDAHTVPLQTDNTLLSHFLSFDQ